MQSKRRKNIFKRKSSRNSGSKYGHSIGGANYECKSNLPRLGIGMGSPKMEVMRKTERINESIFPQRKIIQVEKGLGRELLKMKMIKHKYIYVYDKLLRCYLFIFKTMNERKVSSLRH